MFVWKNIHFYLTNKMMFTYDTIRDAILTCARKKTWVSLIYRTAPTTEKCNNRKTKSSKQICSEITVTSLGNPCSESWRRTRSSAIAEGPPRCVVSAIAIKIPLSTVQNCCNKEKYCAAKCCTWSAVGQSLMAYAWREDLSSAGWDLLWLTYVSNYASIYILHERRCHM